MSTMESLEAKVDNTAQQLGIDTTTWTKFHAKLDALKTHNQRMYCHSLRVGLYACGLAREEHADDCRLSFYGGCGHDIGKAHVDNCVLDCVNWGEAESVAIKCHPREGFEMLKDEFLYAGFVAGLHHRLQANGYGIDLDVDAPFHLSDAAKETILGATKLVIVSDFFDALTTRNNNKGFVKDINDTEEVKTFMFSRFPENHDRVEWLVTHKFNDR